MSTRDSVDEFVRICNEQLPRLFKDAGSREEWILRAVTGDLARAYMEGRRREVPGIDPLRLSTRRVMRISGGTLDGWWLVTCEHNDGQETMVLEPPIYFDRLHEALAHCIGIELPW